MGEGGEGVMGQKRCREERTGSGETADGLF